MRKEINRQMSVSKAELITQIVNSSGLKGKELEEFKKQLQAKSAEDLSAMISNLEPQNIGFKNFVEMPTPKQTTSKNIWGSDIKAHQESDFGFRVKEFDAVGQKPTSTTIFTPSEETAMIFLSGLTNTADKNIKAQEKSEGAVDWVVNAYKEALDKETALSNVKKDIKNTQKDIALLNQAAAGELKRTSFIANETETISFAETFKKQRGVEFNEANIQDCEQKSDTFAQVKAATTMIKEVKSNLNSLGVGTVASQFATKEKSEAVFNSLKLCGIDKRAQMDEVLTSIEEKYKNTELVQKYGGEWQFAKIRENGVSKYKNPPEIVRMTSSGKTAQITNEQYRAITQELNLRLNKAYAATINCDIPQDSSSNEIEALTQKQFDFYQKEYENSFATAYGKKDLKALSEAYIQSQQKGVAGVKMAIDMASMATMFVGGGAVLSGAKAVTKGYSVANAAVKGKNIYEAANAASNLTKLTNITDKVAKSKYLMKLSMGLAVANPTQAINKITSEDGMSQEDWKSYGEEVLTKAGFMAMGMGAARVGEFAGSMVKTKGLTKILQESGKSMDEIVDIVTKNPVRFPSDIVKKLTALRAFSATTRFSTEMSVDLMTTAAMQPGGAQNTDYLMSFIGALSGGQAQRMLAPMKNGSKIKHIQQAFGGLDIKLSDAEAGRVLKALDEKANGVKSRQNADAPKISSPKAIDMSKKPIEIKIAPDALKNPEFKTKLKNISHLNGKSFTEAAYDLLVKEFGIEGIAPKLVVKPMDMDFCGAFDKRTGVITINSGFDKASQIGTLAHELKHFEQYSLILNYRLGQNKNTNRSLEYSVGQMLDEVGMLDATKFNADFYRKVADKTQPLDETSLRYKEAKKLAVNTIPLMSGFEKTFESPAHKVGQNVEKLYYTEIEGNNSLKWAARLTGFSSAILKNPPEFKTDLLDKVFYEKETGLIWAKSLASKAESKPVQAEVGRCLAFLSEDIPDTKKPVDLKNLVFQQGKWYKLPSGMSVSVRSTGDSTPLLDAKGWPTDNVTPKGKRMILQVIDKEGKMHLLPATSKENVAQALKIVEYMTKTKEVSYRDAIAPQGLNAKDVPTQNPKDVAAQKLQEKVGLRVDEQRLGETVPKGPFAYKAPDKDLINTIKHLNPEVMTKRYDAMEKVIDECIKNNKDKINEVVNNHPNDTKKQAEVIVGILTNAFDVKGLEPEIVIKKIPNSAEFNTDNGQIAIDPSVQGVSDITGILSHEFVHFLQMKEIVANSGEKGLRDLMKDVPLNEQDEIIKASFIQKLLKHSKENPQNKNSLNHYMARIYQDEYTNYKMPDDLDNNQSYHSQLIEQESYFLGNKVAKDAAQNHLKSTGFDNLRVIEKGDGYEILEDGTIKRTAINSPAGLLDKGKTRKHSL